MANGLFGVTLMFAAAAGEDEETLRARSKAWEKALNAGDARALAALYAPDAQLLPPNAEVVKGQESIEKFWAEFVAGVKGKLDVSEVSVQGDLGYMLGTYELSDVDGKVVDRGKYVEIWKRGDGPWRLYRDIWNTSIPEREAAQ